MKLILFITFIAFNLCKSTGTFCHYSCKSCSTNFNSSACIGCSPSANLINGKCVCPHGLGMTVEGNCEPCHPSCDECALANRPLHCHTCKDSTTEFTTVLFPCPRIFPGPPECQYFERKIGQCKCKSGFGIGRNGMCKKCPNDDCFECSKNSHLVDGFYGRFCECDNGYHYEQEVNGCLKN